MAATETALGALHTALAETLTTRVKDGASASELAVAARFLKDNNITCSPAADNALGELERALAERRTRARKLTEKDREDIAKVADVQALMH